jgi:hypothetical protein
MALLAHTQRSTYCGKAASRLRSRTSPVETELASQLQTLFSQPDLPQIKHYLEAVDERNSAWFRNGLREGWTDLDRRAQNFAELSGVMPDSSTDKMVQASKARRSRC